MQPISESDYNFLKEQADKFDPKLSRIIDNLIIYSSYLHENRYFLIKIEPSETYFLNEKHTTTIPDGNIKRHTKASIVLSINYPTESGLVKVGTCGFTYNRSTKSINLEYIQGKKGIVVDNPDAKKFREDFMCVLIACSHDEIKENLFYPDIINRSMSKDLEKSVGYLRDRFFDKEGRLNIKKINVQFAIKNKLVPQFNDFPNLEVSKPQTIKRRIKIPRRSLK